jgi:hypothetical protein
MKISCALSDSSAVEAAALVEATAPVDAAGFSRKVNDLFLGPVFFYFLVLPSSLGIKADSTALYVIKRRGYAPSLRLIRPRSARICTQI